MEESKLSKRAMLTLKKMNADRPRIRELVARMSNRKDRPRRFAKWDSALSERFDKNLDEAEFATLLWAREAESRISDSEQVVEPWYFTGLTKALVNYGDHLGLSITSIYEFLDETTKHSSRPDSEVRRPLEAIPTSYAPALRDIERLNAKIAAKRFQLQSSQSSTKPTSRVAAAEPAIDGFSQPTESADRSTIQEPSPRPGNADRDQWLYDQRSNTSLSLKQIRLELQKVSLEREWESLGSESAVNAAIQRHADRNGLPKPSPRKKTKKR